MFHYSAYTLIDITNTNVNQYKDQIIQSNQQQNLNTLIQSIGLRSQPINPEVSVLMAQDIVNFGFGKQAARSCIPAGRHPDHSQHYVYGISHR